MSMGVGPSSQILTNPFIIDLGPPNTLNPNAPTIYRSPPPVCRVDIASLNGSTW